MVNNSSKKTQLNTKKRIAFISSFFVLIAMILPPGHIEKDREDDTYMFNNEGIYANSETIDSVKIDSDNIGLDKPDSDIKDPGETEQEQQDSEEDQGTQEDGEMTTGEAVGDQEEEPEFIEASEESISTSESIDKEQKDDAVPQAKSVTGGSTYVNNYAELKMMLETNNGINNIYFARDIPAATNGIDVHPSKGPIMISGKNNSGNFTYYEMSSGITNSIRMPSGCKLIIEDLNIVGRSDYGPFTLNNPSHLTDKTRSLSFNRVNYNGPRLVYMLAMSVDIRDSNILIQQNIGGDVAKDAIEASEVTIGGNTTINKTQGTFSIFGLYNYIDNQSSKLVFEDESNVEINGNSNLITTGTSDYSTVLTVGRNATFRATMGGTMAFSNANSTFINPGSYQQIQSINIGEGATFQYWQVGLTASYSTVVVNDSITVNEGATFDIRRQSPAISLPVSNLLISMENDDSFINFNNPKRVILVNGITGNPTTLAFMRSGNLLINTKVINQWDSLPPFLNDITSEDTMDWSAEDIPTGRWNMKSQRTISLNAYFFSSSFSPYYIADSSNYTTASSLNTEDFTEDNFLGLNRSVFTLGDHYLEVDEVFENSDAISGMTSSNSDLQSVYRAIDGQDMVSSTDSDSTGHFEASITKRLEGGTSVITSSHNNFLMAYSDEIVQPEAILSFYEVPESLSFGNHTATLYDIKGREDPDWTIKVKDTRPGDNEWSVYVSADSPLTASPGGLVSTLPGALCLLEGFNLYPIINTPVLAYEGETSSGAIDGIVPISWAEDQGPVISLSPLDIDNVLMDAQYSTEVTWTLVSGP